MGRRRRGAPAPLEQAIQAAVVHHWRMLGLPRTLVAAIPNQFAHGQPGLTRGLADLLVLAPGLPVAFIELKRDDDSAISDEQRDFGKLCMALDIPYAICIGRDEPIIMLENWGAIRRQKLTAAAPPAGDSPEIVKVTERPSPWEEGRRAARAVWAMEHPDE